MATNLPFSPSPGGTTKITANSTPTSVAGNLTNGAGNATRLRIFNNGTVAVFVKLSATASPTATAADLPLGANNTNGCSIVVDASGITAAAVLSSTTTAADVFFSWGEGGA